MFTLTIGVETLVYEQILYKIRNLRKLCYIHVLYIINSINNQNWHLKKKLKKLQFKKIVYYCSYLALFDLVIEVPTRQFRGYLYFIVIYFYCGHMTWQTLCGFKQYLIWCWDNQNIQLANCETVISLRFINTLCSMYVIVTVILIFEELLNNSIFN